MAHVAAPAPALMRPISRGHRGPAAGRAPIKRSAGGFCNRRPPRSRHGGAAVAAGPEPRAAAPRPPPQRRARLDRAPPQDRAAPAPARRAGECAIRPSRSPAGRAVVGAESPRGSGGAAPGLSRGSLGAPGPVPAPPPHPGCPGCVSRLWGALGLFWDWFVVNH